MPISNNTSKSTSQRLMLNAETQEAEKSCTRRKTQINKLSDAGAGRLKVSGCRRCQKPIYEVPWIYMWQPLAFDNKQINLITDTIWIFLSSPIIGTFLTPKLVNSIRGLNSPV